MEKKILKPKNSKTILLLIVSLVFTISGIMMWREEGLEMLIFAIFFGLGVIVCIIQLIPGSTQLTLTKEGFIITNLFRDNFTKWSDVKLFKIGSISGNNVIMLDYVDNHFEHEIGKTIAKNLSGSHGALPDNYGMKIEELLDLMNEWKNKYERNH